MMGRLDDGTMGRWEDETGDMEKEKNETRKVQGLRCVAIRIK